MKKFLLIILFSSLILSGCTVQKSGKDLMGFTMKINELNEAYLLSPDGFILNEAENTLSKFFIIDDYNILLSFEQDDKFRLIKCNITTEEASLTNENVYNFVTDVLRSFICDDDLTNTVLKEADFSNVIKANTKNTIKVKNGNIELLLDVTEHGTVITVNKNI
ncbi:MAG: hypothetical protein IKC01_03580 [Clostridia bacterium]|nr:hypothetical protein [Clostridia bacterium]